MGSAPSMLLSVSPGPLTGTLSQIPVTITADGDGNLWVIHRKDIIFVGINSMDPEGNNFLPHHSYAPDLPTPFPVLPSLTWGLHEWAGNVMEVFDPPLQPMKWRAII